MLESQLTVVFPEWILQDVGHNDWFAPVRSGTARPVPGSDWYAIYGTDVGFGKARGYAVPEAPSIEKQHRAVEPLDLRLDQADQNGENVREWSARRDHLKYTVFARKQACNGTATAITSGNSNTTHNGQRS